VRQALHTRVDRGFDVCFAPRTSGCTSSRHGHGPSGFFFYAWLATLFEGNRHRRRRLFSASWPAAAVRCIWPRAGQRLAKPAQRRRSRVPMVVVVGDHATYTRSTTPRNPTIYALAGSSSLGAPDIYARMSHPMPQSVAESISNNDISTLIRLLHVLVRRRRPGGVESPRQPNARRRRGMPSNPPTRYCYPSFLRCS